MVAGLRASKPGGVLVDGLAISVDSGFHTVEPHDQAAFWDSNGHVRISFIPLFTLPFQTLFTFGGQGSAREYLLVKC